VTSQVCKRDQPSAPVSEETERSDTGSFKRKPRGPDGLLGTWKKSKIDLSISWDSELLTLFL
jgi:hypothetical protein